jgi:hypothetical protein
MFMFGSAGGKISADNLAQVCLSGSQELANNLHSCKVRVGGGGVEH